MTLLNTVDEVRESNAPTSYSLSLPDDPPAAAYTRLYLTILSIDEVAHLLTVQVSGYRTCEDICTSKQQVVLFSIGADDFGRDAIPPSQTIELPPDSSELTTTIQLRLRGNVTSYPFDTYRLTLGTVVQTIDSSGDATFLSPDAARNQLFMRVEQELPRLDMSQPVQVDPQSVRPEHGAFDYLYVNQITFFRPLYLRILIVLIVLLIGATASYALFLRPFHELIVNAGALVLGVWGVRALILGTFPAFVTALDVSLMVIIFLLLCGITVRALFHTYSHSELPHLFGDRRPPQERQAPKGKFYDQGEDEARVRELTAERHNAELEAKARHDT